MHTTIEEAIGTYKVELTKYKGSMDKVPACYDWSEGSSMAAADFIEWNNQLDGWEKALGLTRKEITLIYREVGIVRRKVFPPRDSKR